MGLGSRFRAGFEASVIPGFAGPVNRQPHSLRRILRARESRAETTLALDTDFHSRLRAYRMALLAGAPLIRAAKP